MFYLSQIAMCQSAFSIQTYPGLKILASAITFKEYFLSSSNKIYPALTILN